jgi:hypothetical protein
MSKALERSVKDRIQKIALSRNEGFNEVWQTVILAVYS